MAIGCTTKEIECARRGGHFISKSAPDMHKKSVVSVSSFQVQPVLSTENLADDGGGTKGKPSAPPRTKDKGFKV